MNPWLCLPNELGGLLFPPSAHPCICWAALSVAVVYISSCFVPPVLRRCGDDGMIILIEIFHLDCLNWATLTWPCLDVSLTGDMMAGGWPNISIIRSKHSDHIRLVVFQLQSMIQNSLYQGLMARVQSTPVLYYRVTVVSSQHLDENDSHFIHYLYHADGDDDVTLLCTLGPRT